MKTWLVIRYFSPFIPSKILGTIRTSSSTPEELAESLYRKPFYLKLKEK